MDNRSMLLPLQPSTYHDCTRSKVRLDSLIQQLTSRASCQQLFLAATVRLHTVFPFFCSSLVSSVESLLCTVIRRTHFAALASGPCSPPFTHSSTPPPSRTHGSHIISFAHLLDIWAWPLDQQLTKLYSSVCCCCITEKNVHRGTRCHYCLTEL